MLRRGTCASVEGQRDLCRNAEPDQGLRDAALVDLYKGLVTRKEDLSVLALHETLRAGASSKGPAPEPARARSLKGPCIAGPV